MWPDDTQRVWFMLWYLYTEPNILLLSLASSSNPVFISQPFRCPQNGGVARGGLHFVTETEWRTYATEEVRSRFKGNPKHCNTPINQYFVGAEDVRTCSRVQSQCGFYLKLLQGVDGVEENPNWLQNTTVHDMALNKALWTKDDWLFLYLSILFDKICNVLLRVQNTEHFFMLDSLVFRWSTALEYLYS